VSGDYGFGVVLFAELISSSTAGCSLFPQLSVKNDKVIDCDSHRGSLRLFNGTHCDRHPPVPKGVRSNCSV
jgi:hypothetical protein